LLHYKNIIRARLTPQERIPISPVDSSSLGRGASTHERANMRITRHRAIAAATAAAIAISSLAVSPASARPYHHRSAGGAAVLGAVAGVFGTIAALAARDRYERDYGYSGYGPYYAPPPAPYGYYGPGYGPGAPKRY
jgi:hypothetical protein